MICQRNVYCLACCCLCADHTWLIITNSSPDVLQTHHMKEIQRLMGCLLFADRPPADTPYADLLTPTHWDEVAQEFARQACSVMGQVR